MDDSDAVREAEQLLMEIDKDDYDDPRIGDLQDKGLELLDDLAVYIDHDIGQDIDQ